ncbi:MAG: TolC family protein [Parafilimonas sp.]
MNKKWHITTLFILFAFLSFSQNNTLDYYITTSLSNSPLLKSYQNQILSNRLDSQILRATLKTQVNFLSNNSYAPIVNGYGYDEVITNKQNVSALVQASKNFPAKNNITAQLRAISLQNQSLLDTIRLSEKDLIKAVSEQYIIAYGDLVTMNFNADLFDLLKNEDIILKKLTQSNVYKQIDYLSFYVTLQQQELTLLQSQIQYDADYLTLNYVAGIWDTKIIQLQEPHLMDTLQYNFINSIFYRRFSTDSLRIENEKALIKYEYKPKIGSYADAGYNSSLQFQPYKNFGVSAGFSLTVPIYDARQRTLKYSKLDIRERTRLANKDFFRNQYFQQVAQLTKQLHATDELVSKINEQITYVKTLITANQRLLETGDIRIADYVLAINNYLTAKNLLNQNYISRLKILNQINYWNR